MKSAFIVRAIEALLESKRLLPNHSADNTDPSNEHTMIAIKRPRLAEPLISTDVCSPAP